MLTKVLAPSTVDHVRALRDQIFADSTHFNPEWVSRQDATVIAQENDDMLCAAFYGDLILACNIAKLGGTWWVITNDYLHQAPPSRPAPDCWQLIPTEESLAQLRGEVAPFDCMLFADDLGTAFSFSDEAEFTLIGGPQRVINAYAGSYEAAFQDFSTYTQECVDVLTNSQISNGRPATPERFHLQFQTAMSQFRRGNS